MVVKKQFKIGLMRPRNGKIILGSGFLEDYDSSTANFFSFQDMLNARSISFDVLSDLKNLNNYDLVFSPGEVDADFNKIKSFVNQGGIFLGAGYQRFAAEELKELFGINFLKSKVNFFPVTEKLIVSDISCPKDYQLNILDSIHPFSVKNISAETIAHTKNTSYLTSRTFGKGKAIFLYDLGVGLFLRSIECTHSGKELNLSNKGIDDIEPYFWLFLKKTIIEKQGFVVYSSISPKIKSFSIAHDTESIDCLTSSKEILKLNESFGIKSTWYLRTNSNYHYDGSSFLYTKPLVLNDANYDLKTAKKYLGESTIGIHSEQFNWVKNNRIPQLDPEKEFNNSLKYLRNSGQLVRSGSMHFGNYAEYFPQDYIDLSKSEIKLWRNSYRSNGVTCFRPYLLFHENKRLSLLGYSDNIVDDFSPLDLNNSKFKLLFEKNLFWVKTLGEGNIFLHSHPHNWDEVKGAIRNYLALYQALNENNLLNVNNEEIIDYYLEKDKQEISYSIEKNSVKIFLKNTPKNILIILESKQPREVFVFLGKNKLKYYKTFIDKTVLSFSKLNLNPNYPKNIPFLTQSSFRRIKVLFVRFYYKLKQIPGRIVKGKI